MAIKINVKPAEELYKEFKQTESGLYVKATREDVKEKKIGQLEEESKTLKINNAFNFLNKLQYYPRKIIYRLPSETTQDTDKCVVYSIVNGLDCLKESYFKDNSSERKKQFINFFQNETTNPNTQQSDRRSHQEIQRFFNNQIYKQISNQGERINSNYNYIFPAHSLIEAIYLLWAQKGVVLGGHGNHVKMISKLNLENNFDVKVRDPFSIREQPLSIEKFAKDYILSSAPTGILLKVSHKN